MGLFFEPSSMDACCLCGATENLTGEHKVKASALRSEFGSDRMTIGTSGTPEEGLRLAQGPKSKEFHFASRMCENCNSKLTQPADKEFERFHREARALFDKGDDPIRVFGLPQYAPGSAAYLNVFRYFAKLLCCHMAEVHAPRRQLMTRFARRQSDVNCIWLSVDEDIVFKQATLHGLTQYAAHGGLTVYGDKETGGANGFHSTLTIGPIRYVFYSRLNAFEKLALMMAHPNFHRWCRESVEAAKIDPISHADQVRLGLIAED
jgi:hypothetical protein